MGGAAGGGAVVGAAGAAAIGIGVEAGLCRAVGPSGQPGGDAGVGTQPGHRLDGGLAGRPVGDAALLSAGQASRPSSGFC